jgi:hypothetical protein
MSCVAGNLRDFFWFSSFAVRFLKTYLRRRSQCVFVNEVVSGQLLFSLFIDDLCAMVTSMYHVYADDFQIYERLNADLCRMHQWSLENGLLLNAGKTQAMIICRDKSRLVHPLPVLSLDGEVIPYSRNKESA